MMEGYVTISGPTQVVWQGKLIPVIATEKAIFKGGVLNCIVPSWHAEDVIKIKKMEGEDDE